MNVYVCVCVRVNASVRVWIRIDVRVRMFVCVYACTCVRVNEAPDRCGRRCQSLYSDLIRRTLRKRDRLNHL